MATTLRDMHDPARELSLDEARAQGFVVDYPDHPRGVGAPVEVLPGKAPRSRRFDRFFVHSFCPFAGWLEQDDIPGRTPAFKAGRSREDALAFIKERCGDCGTPRQVSTGACVCGALS